MQWADGFIAVDWGTTNRRAYQIDRSGACVASSEDGLGVLSVEAGGLIRYLREQQPAAA